jgi:hypothetical protein
MRMRTDKVYWLVIVWLVVRSNGASVVRATRGDSCKRDPDKALVPLGGGTELSRSNSSN